MKNLWEVLAQKEKELDRLKKEVDALHISQVLLREESDPPLSPEQQLAEAKKRWP